MVVRIVPASFVGSLSTESGGRLGKKEPGVSGDLSVFLCDKPSHQIKEQKSEHKPSYFISKTASLCLT